jgi:hypothetical protein
MRPEPIDLLIAGTPRSGTTLLQRLATGLEGVTVPPETHLLSMRGLPCLRHRAFPLAENELVEELEVFRSLPTSEGLELDVARVVAILGGSCRSLWDLFAAVTRALAGSAGLVGEKTPEHLHWWRPLSRVWPSLRFVLVVRDPRAVVASNLDVPFGMDSVNLLARRWRADEAEIAAAASELPGERCLVVRYEDVVGDADAVRDELSSFVGRRSTGAADLSRPAATPLHLPREWWKRRAMEPIDTGRKDFWRERLSDRDVALVESLCELPMRRNGYCPESRAEPHLSLGDRLRALRFEATWRWRRWEIRRSA